MSSQWFPVKVLRHEKKGVVVVVWMDTEKKAKGKVWESDDYKVADLVKWDTRHHLGKSLASTPRCPHLAGRCSLATDR